MVKVRAKGSEESINTLSEFLGGEAEMNISQIGDGLFLLNYECEDIDPLNIREPYRDEEITDQSDLTYRNGLGIISKLLGLELQVINEPMDEPITSFFHLKNGECLAHKIWNESGESPDDGEDEDWDKSHSAPDFEIEYDLIDLYFENPPEFTI